MDVTYTLVLSKDSLDLYAAGLMNLAKTVCIATAQSQNIAASLRENIVNLQNINNELMSLDKEIDTQDKSREPK